MKNTTTTGNMTQILAGTVAVELDSTFLRSFPSYVDSVFHLKPSMKVFQVVVFNIEQISGLIYSDIKHTLLFD